MLRVEDYRHIVPDQTLAEIYARARRLYGKRVVHINATFQGGGVAEILYPLSLLMNDVGVDTDWRILHGSQEFFEITKSFHNALQGAPFMLSERKKQVYLQVNDNFSRFTHLYHDCVIIHDPQPLSLISASGNKKSEPWIWRCHIDLTDPNKELWDFLKGFALKYDLAVFSSEKYLKKDLPIDQKIVFPAINPLSRKNISLSEKAVLEHVKKAGIPTDKPILTQVSRLDPWKDPEGVVDVFERVKEKVDCRLLFCYNVASDDPEGMRMFTKVQRRAKNYLKNGEVLFVVGNDEILVNAVQCFSDVILQKSTREGFCLAVTEALWKSKPVVASNVGGIPMQIEDGKNGFLLDPKDNQGFADRIIHLLKNPKEGQTLGRHAKETVRNKFLMTRLLSDYLTMLDSLICR